jgi:hypothetical protein
LTSEEAVKSVPFVQYHEQLSANEAARIEYLLAMKNVQGPVVGLEASVMVC